jgi:hypothetical protein
LKSYHFLTYKFMLLHFTSTCSGSTVCSLQLLLLLLRRRANRLLLLLLLLLLWRCMLLSEAVVWCRKSLLL